MKNFFSIVLLLAASFGMAAKNQNFDIKGRVYDETGSPLPYATVALLSLPDSTLVTGTTTDMEGKYHISTNLSKGLIMVSILGYEDVYADFDNAKEIHMTLSEMLLGEAVVKAVMPKTKLTGDGMLTSVHGSVLEHAGSANDVLRRIPGVIRSKDGLEVIGKGSPLIYINGRKMTDSMELDRLQSHEIQSIEVINNPGAQYSASVTAVIRIKTVRRQGEGFGFNMGLSDAQSLRVGRYNDPMAYSNFNYRRGPVDVFAGGSYLRFHSSQDADMLQKTMVAPFYEQVGTLFYEQLMTQWGVNGGFNWQIAANHFIGARIEKTQNPREDVHQVLVDDFIESGQIKDHIVSTGDHKVDDRPSSIGVNAYYNGQVGKLGIDFNADIYGVGSSQLAHTEENSTMVENAVINTSTHMDSRLYATKLVLSYPVWQGKLDVGTEEMFTRTHNDYTIVSDLIPSSESDVAEDNIAFFGQYGCAIPKIGQLSAGLRYEHVSYTYDDKLGLEDLDRRYDNIFPTLAFATQIGKVQGSLSYSVKTQRPPFSSLSSAIRYHSRYVLQSGNAMLQPQTNHQLGMNLHWNFLTFVTQYAKVENSIAQWSELYSDDGMVIVRPVNLEKPIRTLSSFVNMSPTIGIWTMNYTLGVQQQWLDLDIPVSKTTTETKHISFSDKPMWIAQLQNVFTFKNNWQAELGAEYHSKAYSQNAYLTNNYLDLSMAVQKSLLKDNSLIIRIEGSDLAGTANYNVQCDYGAYMIRQDNIMSTKKLTVSLKYNFNAARSKYRGTGAGQDAMSRMK